MDETTVDQTENPNVAKFHESCVKFLDVIDRTRALLLEIKKEQTEALRAEDV